ncbi:MAG: hypothetical protein ACOC3V_04675 [bacterium]
MANEKEKLKKVMEQATQQVQKEIMDEVSSLADDFATLPTLLSDLDKKNIFGKLLRDIINNNVDSVKQLLHNNPNIYENQIYIRRINETTVQKKYGIENISVLNIYGEPESVDLKLRTYFYGGEDPEDEEIIISPHQLIASGTSSRFYDIGKELQSYLNNEINERIKSYTKKLSIDVKDDKE